MTNISEYMQNVGNCINATLEDLLPVVEREPKSIHKLMRYSVFAGGKRIRPVLVMAAYEACGGTFGDKKALLSGAAIEMLHTFSLIHDDLPCMDDDDFRRGKPTAHKAFTESLAVLGGDALCIHAFEILCSTGRIDIVKEIATSLGTSGMIGGQVVDIESEGKKVDIDTVKYIHNNKTAALIRASIVAGAMLADASKETITKLAVYGNCIGLLFQVVDDILDEEGTTEILGKDAGSDKARGKATFPSLLGMKMSKKYATGLVTEAHKQIMFLGEKGALLSELTDFIRVRIS